MTTIFFVFTFRRATKQSSPSFSVLEDSYPPPEVDLIGADALVVAAGPKRVLLHLDRPLDRDRHILLFPSLHRLLKLFLLLLQFPPAFFSQRPRQVLGGPMSSRWKRL